MFFECQITVDFPLKFLISIFMQPVQEDDGKDGRYFPSDSEMPILIHYLQIYFSHPERSIQRSQVVQNVASILSPTNKHWNHRTIRLWFNNNKRVFYRPTSPQNVQPQNEPNQISPTASVSGSFSQDIESQNQSIFNSPPIPKYYLPSRSLSVVQMPAVVDTNQEQRMNQYASQNLNTGQQMNASQWEHMQRQQQANKLDPDSFALHLSNVRDHITESNYDFQSQKDCEARTTEKIASIHDQKWYQMISMHPCIYVPIKDKSSIPNCQDKNANPFSFQVMQPANGTFLDHVVQSSSTPPSPPSNPGPLSVPSQISNPTSPSSSYSSSPSPAPSSPTSSLDLSNFPNSPEIKSNQSTPFPLGVCPYDLIETSTFSENGMPFMVSYDISVQADQIHLNLNPTSNSYDVVCQTGFLSPVSSIAYDAEASHLWAHSGNFVRSFNCNSVNSTIEIDQTILTGSHHSLRSAMTFWDKNLVLSSNSTILTWKREIMYPPIDMDRNEEEINENFGVCLTLIVPNIDSLTTVDEYLVVASSDYHTAHIIAQNGACASRAIGHTAGITSLHKYDSNSFITGSADQTAKFWDVRVPVAIHSLHRHKGIITSVFGDGNNGSNLIFTGGTDGVIRSWDIRKMKHVFSINIGEATPQSIFYDSKGKVLRAITSEKCKDYFYDLGKFSYQNHSEQIVDFGLNSILSFQCVNE